MAAKSDGAAVAVEDDNPPRSLSEPGQATPAAGAASIAAAGAAATRPRRGPTGGQAYTLLDCFWVLCALLVFFSDGATDLWLAADYYLRDDYWWFGLTLVFVVVPSAVVQVLSFRWFVYDYTELSGADGATGAVGEATGDAASGTKDSDQRGAGAATGNAVNSTAVSASSCPSAAPERGGRPRRCCTVCMWVFQTVLHALQLGQVWRYIHALYLGAQSRWHSNSSHHRFHWRLMFESADITMLRLLEAFLKSAPQLVLQLSIMIHGNAVLPLQGLSASASLVSLAWMIASYQKVLRDSRDDKLPMSYKAVIAQILWHLFTIGARTVAFALFASVFQLYFGIFIVSHWCIMTFWIIQGETDFCMSKWEEIIYNMVVGIIYIFCWFNVKEGPSRIRMTVYYTVTLAENVALTAAWYTYRGPYTSDSYALIVVCLVACSFALGTFFMLVYYCWLHPDGPVLGTNWGGCVDEGIASASGVVGVIDACLTPSQGSQTDMVITSPPRTLPRTKDTGDMVPGEQERDKERDRDSCLPVFQVRPSPSSSPALLHRTSSSQEGPVIRIDLPRKRYPAWDAHFIDRRLRKTILILETTSAVSPRIQYRSSMMGSKEVLEYETTV
ncbi:XK-related protein 7-like [Corythoichthys intestinalis]|uniref:XK-related protein 7-like n=1 Tax=Corythoichthys intestinalis TaxID=161448 RepID=UPI0025A61EB3|nr:XK-related protein 7-like [Corythoichthys intestinalis]XP_061803036.1 XK-related protein 7-like [Nerophis lumbriciformis]